mgnify:FL=1|jgi:hypothetical protein|tara:strand:+ start:257 stop:661 length:405 start_codon:yes stop_codon:yes gene_type:complete
MVEDNLKIKSSGIPHLPFHIIDENGNVIADLFHNIDSVTYARLFKNASRMNKILWDVLENYSVSINSNTVTDRDLKILKDISELQLELSEPIDNRNETSWQDEVFEKHKDEPLPEVFLDPNQTNIIDQIENKQE